MDHFYESVEGWFCETDKKIYDDAVDKFTDGDVFVEIGSWKGRSASAMAVNIVNSNKAIKFFCVDTWKGSEEHQEGQVFADVDVIGGSLLDRFLENTKPVENHIQIIRKESTVAANDFEDHSLAFVYIDASHDYESVKKDLNAWYPKVKKGGILAGHDWGWVPVKNAVANFCANNGLTVTGDTSWKIQL